LTYAINKKNKNNSRITIFGNYKIMINSLEVCFGVKRQYAKFGGKNLIIFSYKIIFADSAEMESNFYKNSYNITLCNC
jgi:hypothetical protein